MQISLESPDQPEVIALIKELDDYQDSLYPPESRHSLDLVSLKQPQVRFAVARDDEARAIGCGAVVLGADYGELKRMFVQPRGRGQGVASGLLALLEAEARRAGCHVLKLETGPYQPEALGLYAKRGYQRCAPFGKYKNDPLSVFMQKPLDSTAHEQGRRSMILVHGSVVAREGSFAEALALSQEHVNRSRAEPGCIAHAVHRDTENPQRLVFVEQWASQAALWDHFKLPASRAFAKALAGLAAAAPEMALFEATPIDVPGRGAAGRTPA